MPIPTPVSARAIAGAATVPAANTTSQAAFFMAASSPRYCANRRCNGRALLCLAGKGVLSTRSEFVAARERPFPGTEATGILRPFRRSGRQAMSEGFYLGKELDPKSGKLGDRVLLDPADLLTHGLVVGMTGSGKTGLAIAILQVAVRPGDPGRGLRSQVRPCEPLAPRRAARRRLLRAVDRPGGGTARREGREGGGRRSRGGVDEGARGVGVVRGRRRFAEEVARGHDLHA